MLGLGSQIKPHITKRFSMEWSRPAARMREMVQAVRAIWDTWQNGTPLRFRGEFYQHTLMTPMFTPKASDLGDFGPPKVYLAGVGPLMTEVAGEVCDGFLCHPFTTEKYLHEVTLPALERGRAKAGATMEGYEIAGPSFVVTGETDEQMERSAAATRQQIAFYGSTPAYRPVLEVHGWGDLQNDLMSKRGQWVEMAALIDDDALNTFAVVAPPEEIARRTRPPLRRHHQPDLVLRPVPGRPGPPASRHGCHQSHLGQISKGQERDGFDAGARLTVGGGAAAGPWRRRWCQPAHARRSAGRPRRARASHGVRLPARGEAVPRPGPEADSAGAGRG